MTQGGVDPVAELDFSALDKVAYRGFETVAEQEKKDALIEQGFTIAEADEGNPFLQASSTASQTASEPPKASAVTRASSAPQTASKGKTEAFTDASGTRNYKALYRAAHDYHKRHAPPLASASQEEDIAYWREAATDMCSTGKAYKDDPFLESLLVAVYDELIRQYKTLREARQHSTT